MHTCDTFHDLNQHAKVEHLVEEHGFSRDGLEPHPATGGYYDADAIHENHTATLYPELSGIIRPYPKPVNERAELTQELLLQVATELMIAHCDTGISLDNWDAPRALVEAFYGPIIENGV